MTCHGKKEKMVPTKKEVEVAAAAKIWANASQQPGQSLRGGETGERQQTF